MTALCTGSFDPITVGHYDYISRTAAIFDKVVVAVCTNTQKRYMFSAEARLRYVQQAFAGLPNVSVVAGGGWVADLAAKHGASVIVKGVRNGADLDYEDTIAYVNREISTVETLLLPAAPEVSCINSTAVREMIKYGKDYAPYIPKGVCIDKSEACL